MSDKKAVEELRKLGEDLERKFKGFRFESVDMVIQMQRNIILKETLEVNKKYLEAIERSIEIQDETLRILKYGKESVID